MKTLVIIDDEVFFRKSLINFLEKQNIYKIVGEANNGQAGIKLIENIKPDIALVDISMPVMSGLDMIAALGTDFHTRFILSTGYEDFEYAKKAISLQVRGYLLKPLDHQELMETLQKVSDELDQENSRNSYVNDYFQFRNLYKRQMQLNFFQKVISGTALSQDDLEEIPVYKNSSYLTLLMQIHSVNSEMWDKKGDFSLLHTILENICREILQPVCRELIYIDYSQMRQYIIMEKNSDVSFSDLEKFCLNLAGIYDNIAQISTFFCCGTPHEGVEGIRYSYEEALSVFHNSSASSSGFLYFTPQSYSADFTLKPLIYDDILIFLRQRNSQSLNRYIDEYFNDIITKKIHIRQTWSVAAAFLTVLDGFITECNQREILFPLIEDALNTYQDCQNALQLKQLIQSTCNAVLDSLANQKNSRKSALVSQVQEYIRLNFNHPDLRLETIASHFFINSQHLSTVFSQETGTTLTSYINICRMKKARQFLLRDSPSIQNVAVLCGFSDSGYFSKCFRKYYGISPKNFMSLTEKNSHQYSSDSFLL